MLSTMILVSYMHPKKPGAYTVFKNKCKEKFTDKNIRFIEFSRQSLDRIRWHMNRNLDEKFLPSIKGRYLTSKNYTVFLAAAETLEILKQVSL